VRLTDATLVVGLAFVVAVAACGSPTTPATNAQRPGMLSGRITAGPTCPVEQAGHPCPPQPVAAQVVVRDRSGRTVATTRSRADGTYQLSVAAGAVALEVLPPGPFPRCTPVDVTVAPAQAIRADITCDTGIR